MSKLSSRTAAVVGDLVDTAIMWLDNATSTSSIKATWLVIRTKLETYFPTRSEVTAEITAAVAGLYDHKGAYNASTNTPDLDTSPTGIKKSDAYTVSVAGTFYAVAVAAGDVLIADQDNPTASTHWTIVNRNIDESAFATSAQGALADTAVQPADVIGRKTEKFYVEAGLQQTGSGAPAISYQTFVDIAVKCYDLVNSGFPSVVAKWIPDENWNAGTIRHRFWWAPSSANTGNALLQNNSTHAADTEAMPSKSFEASISDAGAGTAGVIQTSAWSSTYTVGSAAPGDIVMLEFFRNADSGSDTFTGTVYLLAVELEYYTDAPTEA